MEEDKKVDDAESETSTEIAASWNSAQEDLMSAIADRSNPSSSLKRDYPQTQKGRVFTGY